MKADQILVDTVERLLATTCTHELVEASEVDGINRAAWEALHEAGFDRIGLDEGLGGSGGSVHDMAAVLVAVGRHAAAVPVAETGFTAGWWLTTHGLHLPTGAVTLIDNGRARVESGRLIAEGDASFARHCETIVVNVCDETGVRVFAVPAGSCTITAGADLAGEARDRVIIDIPVDATPNVTVAAGEPLNRRLAELDARLLLAPVLKAVGSIEVVAQMTIDYTNSRRQFGKPVATFQAVQHHLVDIAEAAVAVRMAAEVALSALADRRLVFEAEAARLVMADSIAVGTRAAHQSHGAMGVTREYRLQQFTRRLWALQHAHGPTSKWRLALGRRIAETGPDEFFATITR